MRESAITNTTARKASRVRIASPPEGESQQPQPSGNTAPKKRTSAVATPSSAATKKRLGVWKSQKDLKKVNRCANRDTRKHIVGAIRAGFPYKMNRNGLTIYGDDGQAVTVHFTESDGHAARNTLARLRAIGYDPERKTS